MMQMNIERVINATGSLLIWLVMILAAVILVGLIVITVNGIVAKWRNKEDTRGFSGTEVLCGTGSFCWWRFDITGDRISVLER